MPETDLTLSQAITQLKRLRDSLRIANLEYQNKESIIFRLDSIKAIDRILKELGKCSTD